MRIAPRRQGFADARRAIAQANVAMFSDRVGELYKAPMLFGGDECSYLATVVLHGSVAIEIGSQLGFFAGATGGGDGAVSAVGRKSVTRATRSLI